ncbi:HET-domain-containing protein [Aulographum hederae CBS 113979]|uniref:HET-domain-containing protein n=1 Tax=Aulographum hederae CBS 113979 TaxID=1176131 RepID=A0A6G1GIE4_9PEZI|nr:HET-domain-containing protein [Aulographum hederae CBS 113979]
MRLINTETLELEEFYLKNAPPYAILSHTWGDEEVTSQDMAHPVSSQKKGYRKIAETCRLAQEAGFDWCWVDTCCIDKASSAELTESINSMFNWYSAAEICVVFLEDLEPSIHHASADNIIQCRWFTRGWTLQELIAPSVVRFYDSTWTLRGTKSELSKIIARHTRIPIPILLNDDSVQLCSVAGRMSWAANRETTRLEDQAYSLLGIFGVNMPLLYGEGPKAFRRLQEEIIKRDNDLTIFAWDVADWNVHGGYISQSLFAPSPAAFAKTYGVSIVLYGAPMIGSLHSHTRPHDLTSRPSSIPLELDLTISQPCRKFPRNSFTAIQCKRYFPPR